MSYSDSSEEIHSQNIKCLKEKKKSYQVQKTKEADDRRGGDWKGRMGGEGRRGEGRGQEGRGGSIGIGRSIISTGLTTYYFGILNSL